MSQLDWGSVPAWVAALITSASAAVAVTSYSRSLYDKKREQAAMISCWVAEASFSRITISHKEVYWANTSVGVKVANRSDSPVYDVEVTFPESTGEPFRSGELAPGVTATGKMQLQERYRSKISPGANEVPAHITIETPTLIFTDALGRRWRRRKGHVRRIRQRTQLYAILQAASSQDIQTTWTSASDQLSQPDASFTRENAMRSTTDTNKDRR